MKAKKMSDFEGFPEGKIHQTPIPDPFFSRLLPKIDHLGELKLILHFFWRLGHMEGPFRYLRRDDLVQDNSLMSGLASDSSEAEAILDEALERAVEHNILMRARLTDKKGQPIFFYFMNSPKGRAAILAIQKGEWRPEGPGEAPVVLAEERPNIYSLYEENIGPLSPMIAEAISEAEKNYPIEWISDALRIAVENNKRNWRYVMAILERWYREGKDASKKKSNDQRDSEEDRQRYVKGKYSDFIEH